MEEPIIWVEPWEPPEIPRSQLAQFWSRTRHSEAAILLQDHTEVAYVRFLKAGTKSDLLEIAAPDRDAIKAIVQLLNS